MTQLQYHLKSKICDLYLIASDLGLCAIEWKKQNIPMTKSLTGKAPEILILKKTVLQLEQYFKGTRQKFELPVDIVGTDFQIQVWQALAQIPYAETVSYSDIAKKIKNPKAVRAVGSANGKNPLAIIVPCHRVIAADGTMGGYAGGLKIKKALLDLELK
jgi:methylated-DNA-[protein]-cysteine S-methyltransferase